MRLWTRRNNNRFGYSGLICSTCFLTEESRCWAGSLARLWVGISYQWNWDMPWHIRPLNIYGRSGGISAGAIVIRCHSTCPPRVWQSSSCSSEIGSVSQSILAGRLMWLWWGCTHSQVDHSKAPWQQGWSFCRWCQYAQQRKYLWWYFDCFNSSHAYLSKRAGKLKLRLSHKAVLSSGNHKLSNLLIKGGREQFYSIKAEPARDLGVSHSGCKRRPQQIFAEKLFKSELRVRKISKLALLNRAGRCETLALSYPMEFVGHLGREW